MVNGLEISKLATMTVHPALRQRLYAGIQYTNENHSVITWLMAACHVVWPNKSDIPLNTGLWSSMEDLQNYIRELGVRQVIYEDSFESPDTVRFLAGMRDLILQQAPSHLYGTLVSILNPLVNIQSWEEWLAHQKAVLSFRRTWTGFQYLPHPWRHSKPGWMWLWAALSSGWRPCTSQGG